MGFLRLFFALNVFFGHSGTIANSIPSVESFFIISGFYISLILNEKYTEKKKKSNFLFITNRFLRIYPSYWIVLILLFLLKVHRYDISLNLTSFSLSDIIQNILIFPSVNLFINKGEFIKGFLNPPAWSLGIEFIFYFLAPFIVRNSKRAFFIFIMSFPLGFLFYDVKVLQVFYLFMLGSLSYFAYKKFWILKKSVFAQRKMEKRVFLGTIIVIGVLAMMMPNLLSIHNLWIQVVYYVGIASVMPFIFSFTSKSRVDRLLGNFSYPVYVCHQLVLEFFWGKVSSPNVHIIIVALFVLSLSFILYKFIDVPIQKYKLKRNTALKK